MLSVGMPIKFVYEEYELNLYQKIGDRSMDSRVFALASFPPFAKVMMQLAADQKEAAKAIRELYESWFFKLEKEIGDVSLSSKYEELAEKTARDAVCKTVEILLAPILAAKTEDEDRRLQLLLNMAFNATQMGILMASGPIIKIDLNKLTKTCTNLDLQTNVQQRREET